MCVCVVLPREDELMLFIIIIIIARGQKSNFFFLTLQRLCAYMYEIIDNL